MMLEEELKAVIDASGQTDGFAHSYFGINDEDSNFANAEMWTAFKREGGGRVHKEYGTPNIRVWVGGKSAHRYELLQKANAIIDYMNANPRLGSIFHIVVQSDLLGPLPLSNGRHYFEINLQIFNDR